MGINFTEKLEFSFPRKVKIDDAKGLDALAITKRLLNCLIAVIYFIPCSLLLRLLTAISCFIF